MQQVDDDTISLEWTTDDVKLQLKNRGQENSLTDDECRNVLYRLLHKHDATIGVNWDVIDACIDYELSGKESNANHKPTN
tara:strand:+ start:1199 stop:1438 length:240 start_codon:yes stop_codon:yes gene_type:complete